MLSCESTHTVEVEYEGRRLVVSEPGRAFKRRAIKGAGSPNAREVCWLVGELDGVRCYVTGSTVVLTRDDLTP